MLHASLSPIDSARLHACASAEGAVLFRPPLDTEPIPDPHMKIWLKMRLGFDDVVQRASPTCLNVSRRFAVTSSGGHGCGSLASGTQAADDRRVCGVPMMEGNAKGDGAKHAVTCTLGGGVMLRHDGLRDGVHDWMQTIEIAPRKEQNVPEWDTPEERAVLDLVYRNPTGVIEYLDVSVIAAATRTSASAAQLLARREQKKHKRYPGENLIPFVVDIRGKWGREAIAWSKGMLRPLMPEERAEAAHRLRWEVAKAVSMAVGEQVLTSMHGVRSRPRG